MVKLLNAKLVSRSCGYDHNCFKATFASEPTLDDIADTQFELGFDPAGYGGPYWVTYDHLDDNTWEVSWKCAGSCD